MKDCTHSGQFKVPQVLRRIVYLLHVIQEFQLQRNLLSVIGSMSGSPKINYPWPKSLLGGYIDV